MILGKKDYNNSLLFIIEEAQFNLGNFDKAIQMIELAGKTGANAIEFQLAYADDFYIKSDQGHAIYKQREFSDEQLKMLVDCAHECGLHFIATCLSHKLVEKMANFNADGFNINASDINNPSIVDAVTSTNLPFFISMPLATVAEINWVVARIEKLNKNANYAFLHGQHPMASGKEYVEIEDTSLGFIAATQLNFGKSVGFIDHTPLKWMPAIAVAAGAKIITKHLTISPIFNGPDNIICLNPEDMKDAVSLANKVFHSINVKSKELAKGEDLDRTIMRRSIVSSRNLKAGEILDISSIEFKRPGTGISPDQFDKIVGMEITKDLEQDRLITLDFLK